MCCSNGGQRLTNLTTDNNGQQRTETYGYDRLYRLTSVNYGDGEVHSYVFDPMGNRTSKVVNGTPEGYTYDNANRLTSRAGQNYTNDLAGNTLTGGGRTMTWDSQNRMASCVYNGTTSTFTYGADGLRRRMVVGANTTDYLLDGQNVVREILNGNVNAFYLMGARGPEYKRDNAGNVAWYLYDGLGSVVATVDSSGNVLDARKYDVYGAVRAGGAGSRHKFCGQLGHSSDDETGLLYMRARYMDPVVGRFVSEDPGKDGGNWFAYCNNDPALEVDRTGRVPLLDFLSSSADYITEKAQQLMAAQGQLNWFGQKLLSAMYDWAYKYALYDEEIAADLVGGKDMWIATANGFRFMVHISEQYATGEGPHVQLWSEAAAKTLEKMLL